MKNFENRKFWIEKISIGEISIFWDFFWYPKIFDAKIFEGRNFASNESIFARSKVFPITNPLKNPFLALILTFEQNKLDFLSRYIICVS